MPTGKTVGAIILKFLSGIHIQLKVHCFEGLVNQSNITAILPILWSVKQVGIIFN